MRHWDKHSEGKSVVTEGPPLNRGSGRAALRQRGISRHSECPLVLLVALKKDLNHFSGGDKLSPTPLQSGEVLRLQLSLTGLEVESNYDFSFYCTRILACKELFPHILLVICGGAGAPKVAPTVVLRQRLFNPWAARMFKTCSP